MDVGIYPGEGLSLSQLVFALSKELKRAAYSPSFTLDDVSQLDEDVSATSANIREWRNSLVHINRVPLDVLSLVPTHFDSQQDLLNASRVCRYWRRALLERATLWSILVLTEGKSCVRAFLERAKGSALDVITNWGDSFEAITLLSPHTQQIRSLLVTRSSWVCVQGFSGIYPGPLPLLRTLKIDVVEGFRPITDLSPPLFGGAGNLKQLILHSRSAPPFSLLIFPNLTAFTLRITSESSMEKLCTSKLLDFLEASPMLRAVDMVITETSLEDIAQRKAVVLPDVQTFSLTVEDYRPAYELIAHISCPSVTRTSLIYKKDFKYADNIRDELAIFPTATLWNTIVRQYTRKPIEVVTFYTKTDGESFISCTLTFRSSDMALVFLGFEFFDAGLIYTEDGFQLFWKDIVTETFCQGSKIVQDHPLLSNIKHLHILNDIPLLETDRLISMAEEVGELFKSTGPLEGLTLHGCNLHSYLTPFLTYLPDFYEMEQSITYPPIKELTILHPLVDEDLECCKNAIVSLARSQHTLGVPFERVTVRAEGLQTKVAEGLRRWVGVVDCREERYVPVGDEHSVSARAT